MTSHAYPANALVGDYGRAAAGFSLVTLPIVTIELAPTVLVILGGLATLFGVFALRTATRHVSRIQLDESGIASLGWRPTRLEWSALERAKLGFYATKRDGGNGWMQLALVADGKRLAIDSRIENFDAILRATGAAIRARGLIVSGATAANFAARGIEVGAR